MASTDATVTIQVDATQVDAAIARVNDLRRVVELSQQVEELRLIVDALQHEWDHRREEIAAVRDGLDAWAGRIQALERLPGVQEALAAARIVDNS